MKCEESNDFIVFNFSKQYSLLRQDTPLSVVFRNDFWGMPLTSPESHKSYRPLATLTFRWSRQLHGMWSPGFHAVNILLHAAVCCLYFLLCLSLDISQWSAMMAALLFAAHPIHTEAVGEKKTSLNSSGNLRFFEFLSVRNAISLLCFLSM